MKLYLLRHGEAAEHNDPRYKEDERPLTQKGTQRTKQLAHALRQMDVTFDTILSSPLIRARQTAEIVARALKKKVTLTDSLATGSLDGLIADIVKIDPPPQHLLAVGHEPSMSGFISVLCTGGLDLPVKMKKGALCRLDIEELMDGKCAVLEWLLQPRMLDLKRPK